MNRNVRLSSLLAAVSGLARSVWGNAVLAAYLYELTGGSNSKAGLADTVWGLSSLFTALPVGFLADKYSRAGTIALGAVAVLLALGLSLFAVLDTAHERHAYWVMCGALVLWGVASGIQNGPLKALVADSLPKGERSGGFTELFVASLLPRSVGPLISVVMFSRLGDDWSMSSIRTVFTVGLALNAPVVLLMCLFDDAAVLADDDAAVPPELETLDEEAAPTGGAPPGPTGCWGALGRQHIPYILFCSDFFVYVGAGMTVKFFPLYFKNAVGLSPAAVQVLYTLLPLLMAAVSTAAQRFSVAVGRVQCVLCAQFLGIGCLVTMVVLAFVVRCEDWRVMAPLFLVRSTLMSSVIPILDSILMDNVPRETRARWKSLDSIHAVGWCGSAWLGGWVADTFRFNGHDGYIFTFAVTAAMQTTGSCMQFLLLPLVEAEPQPKPQPKPEPTGERAPLLGGARSDGDEGSEVK